MRQVSLFRIPVIYKLRISQYRCYVFTFILTKKNSSFHDINRIVVKTSKYALYMHKITMDCQKNTVLINDMDFTCGQQKKNMAEK